jgi:hypothetical protein
VIKTTLLGSALAVALSAAPAIAADFHALKGLQGATPAPLQDRVLATTEGGATACTVGAVSTSVGTDGVCLISILPAANGSTAAFAVTNDASVTAAVFLQVVGF